MPAPAATETLGNTGGSGLLLWTFTGTLFLSATLLFLIQPMVGKMILPVFGGTPAVWNTCMLFFQAALLAGYAYAHATSSWLGVRRQAAVHVVVLLVPLWVLPIVLGGGAAPSPDASPVFWLLAHLSVTVGLPFFVVATTGPLLQKWFAGTGHASARDPYFLYAASNAGSLLALLGYPLLVEPALAVTSQTHLWAVAYKVMVAMIVLCAIFVWKRSSATTAGVALAPTPEVTSSGEVTLRRRMWWVLAAFVPSSLMLGVTAHITSNLAPVPLLWVLPLALYLLTFVIVFARKPLLPHGLMVRLLPFLLLPVMVLTVVELPTMGWLAILAHLLTFFVATMVCHGRLAQNRPPTRYLTEFYLWMSIGGVLGGIFNAIIAPTVFNTVLEYPIAMLLACLLLPRPSASPSGGRAWLMDAALPLLMGGVTVGVILFVQSAGSGGNMFTIWAVLFVVLAMVCFSFKERPVRFALGLGVFFVAVSSSSGIEEGRALFVGRNFFGPKRVVVDPDGQMRKLIHGTTNHGMQFTDPARSREPLAYFHRTGPLGEVFSTFDGADAKSRVAIIGLGAGAIACYAEKGQQFTFYEIDPEVEEIARNTDYFTFLSQCRGKCDVVLGDGRLTLANSPDGHFGMIILDAFSSDAIPTHLLTREAIQLYLSKLEDDGILVFQITNRYLALAPLLGNLAADAGLVGRTRRDFVSRAEMAASGKTPSHFAVLARKSEHLGALSTSPRWHALPVRPDARVWTDQHTSILSFLYWR